MIRWGSDWYMYQCGVIGSSAWPASSERRGTLIPKPSTIRSRIAGLPIAKSLPKVIALALGGSRASTSRSSLANSSDRLGRLVANANPKLTSLDAVRPAGL